VQDVLVLEAVSSFPKDRPVSIVDVAKSLAIDPSVASRMVAKATRHGLITKRRSQDDPRQVVLLVTSKGESVLSDAHAWQERVFADLTREWEPDDATRLAGYLARLLETLPRIDSAQPRE
jgi:DNA-binding MarR family transcriptional regulator